MQPPELLDGLHQLALARGQPLVLRVASQDELDLVLGQPGKELYKVTVEEASGRAYGPLGLERAPAAKDAARSARAAGNEEASLTPRARGLRRPE